MIVDTDKLPLPLALNLSSPATTAIDSFVTARDRAYRKCHIGWPREIQVERRNPAGRSELGD